MTDDPDATADPTAVLAAFSSLTGADPEVMRQARQAMADAMAAGAAQSAFWERQQAVIEATAAALGGGDNAGQLAPAREAFDLAVETVRALSEMATTMSAEEMDRVVRQFQDQLAKIKRQNN